MPARGPRSQRRATRIAALIAAVGLTLAAARLVASPRQDPWVPPASPRWAVLTDLAREPGRAQAALRAAQGWSDDDGSSPESVLDPWGRPYTKTDVHDAIVWFSRDGEPITASDAYAHRVVVSLGPDGVLQSDDPSDFGDDVHVHVAATDNLHSWLRRRPYRLSWREPLELAGWSLLAALCVWAGGRYWAWSSSVRSAPTSA